MTDPGSTSGKRVPYPVGCNCPTADPGTCNDWMYRHALRMGKPPPSELVCPCPCHTMEPSPWADPGSEAR